MLVLKKKYTCSSSSSVNSVLTFTMLESLFLPRWSETGKLKSLDEKQKLNWRMKWLRAVLAVGVHKLTEVVAPSPLPSRC